MKQQYPFIIDFSFDGKNITVFESGDFYTSSMNRLDRLRKTEGQAPLKDEYLKKLQRTHPHALSIHVEIFPSTSISFHDFSSGHQETYQAPLHTIEELLISIGQLSKDEKIKQSILITLEYLPSINTRVSLANLVNDSFKLLNYPLGVLREAARDKIVFHSFIKKAPLCPPSILIDLREDSFHPLECFFKAHASSHYVIKPPALTLGMGVTVLAESEVIPFISNLCAALRGGDPKGFEEWMTSFAQGGHFALIQTCIPSKILMFEDKPYHPTGRAVITATFNDIHSPPELSFLGKYWELPTTAAEGTLSTSSSVSPVDDACTILPIEDADWDIIVAEINKHFPPILKRMRETPLEELAEQFQSSPAMQAYATDVLGLDKIPDALQKQRNQSDLARKISFIFSHSLEYVSFQTKKQPGFFERILFTEGVYEPNLESHLETSTYLDDKPQATFSKPSPPPLLNLSQHQDAIGLLSRHHTQLLSYFLFCTGLLTLLAGGASEKKGLLMYGLFSAVTGLALMKSPPKKEAQISAQRQHFKQS